MNLGLSDTWRSDANIVCTRLIKIKEKHIVNACIKYLPSMHETLGSATSTGGKKEQLKIETMNKYANLECRNIGRL